MMLAGKHFGRRQQGRLRPGLVRVQHCQQCHQGLSSPDITLQHPQHPARCLLVLPDFVDGT